MEEDDAIFDPTLKKKKKKKTGFNPEIAPETGRVENTEAPAPVEMENGKDDPADIDETEMFGKKKSKRRKPFNLAELSDALEGTPAGDEGADEEGVEASAAPDVDMDLEFDFTSKKKKTKKKKKLDIENLIADTDKENQVEDKGKDDAWGDSERDYSYDELLQRAFDQLREKNPEMAAGEKKKFIMKPPQVLRIGSKKSAFANFSEICRLLHRMPKHVLQFLLAELGTSGSIDGNCQLIIKGRFQQKQIENVLRRYIKEYVTCHTCRSSDTILQKDARLYFLQCEQCNSRCSVAPIKSGFQAVANKQQRQAIRASKN